MRMSVSLDVSKAWYTANGVLPYRLCPSVPRQTQTERFGHGAGTREAVPDVQAH